MRGLDAASFPAAGPGQGLRSLALQQASRAVSQFDRVARSTTSEWSIFISNLRPSMALNIVFVGLEPDCLNDVDFHVGGIDP